MIGEFCGPIEKELSGRGKVLYLKILKWEPEATGVNIMQENDKKRGWNIKWSKIEKELKGRGKWLYLKMLKWEPEATGVYKMEENDQKRGWNIKWPKS